MRVAIPTFRSQVSPRFDCANALLLVDLEDEGETNRVEHSLNAVPPFARAGFLRAQGVKVLLCGGLRRRDFHELNMSGIEVFAGLFGAVEEILAAYCQGRLQPTHWEGRPLGGMARHRRGHGGWGQGQGRQEY